MTQQNNQRQTDQKHPLRDMVALDVRGETSPEEAAHLRDADTVKEWFSALIEMKRDLETQFGERNANAQIKQNECFAMGHAGKREWFEYKAEHDRWRGRANRLKAGIEARIREAKGLLQDSKAQDSLEKDKGDRKLYRDTLHRVGRFLMDDRNIDDSANQMRNELIEAIEEVLEVPIKR